MKSSLGKAFVGVFAGVALLLGAASAQASTLTSAQVQAVLQLLQSFGADQSTINNVATALGTPYYYYGGSYSSACPALSYNLYLGLTDAQTAGQVSQLQRFLGVTPTGYFGTLTRQAVANFQTQYQVYPVTGGVGPLTRAAIARVCGGYPTPIGTLSITGVSGPNSLAVGQQGTWSITTNAPSGSYGSVSVRWGDEYYYGYAATPQSVSISQQNTFSHSYSSPGTYAIVFTATDNAGHSNTASATVVVGGSGQTTNFSASPTYGSAPLTVNFSGSVQTSGQYIVDYGDGTNSGALQSYCLSNQPYPGYVGSGYGCSLSVSHVYSSAGTYTATLSPYIACMYSNPRCMIATQLLGSVTVTVY